MYTAEDWREVRGVLAEMEPELIIVDVNLVGLRSGDVLAGHLKKRYEDATIIFYSAQDSSDLERLTREVGIDGYIAKSTVKELRAAIEAFLSAPPEDAE